MGEPEFKDFAEIMHKLCLHMELADPPIEMDLPHRTSNSDFDFRRFKKNDYYCIDGFPKEDLVSVVVLPPPRIGNYVYQGIRPAVITLSEATEEMEKRADETEAEICKEAERKRRLREGSEIPKEEPLLVEEVSPEGDPE